MRRAQQAAQAELLHVLRAETRGRQAGGVHNLGRGQGEEGVSRNSLNSRGDELVVPTVYSRVATTNDNYPTTLAA